MSHGDFVRPSGQWAGEMVPGQADYQRWDVTQSKAVNGDLGGAWTPSKPLIIGGAGMQLSTPSFFESGVTTKTGGRLVSSGAPTMALSRSRTLTVPSLALGVRVILGSTDLRIDRYIARTAQNRWGLSFSKVPTGVGIDVPRRYLHQGAQLVTFALEFYISQRPVALPTTGMQIFPIGYSYSGNEYDTTPAPGTLQPWLASHSFPSGQYVNPSSQATNTGFYFTTSTTATTGATEPVWPTSAGATVTDGSQTWTCVGRNGWLSTFGATVDTYYANGAGQVLAFDADPASSANLNTMDNLQHGVSALFSNIEPLAVVTGVQISYTHITSMGFE